MGGITLNRYGIAHLRDGGMKRKWGFFSKQGPLRQARRRCRCGTKEQKRARLLGPGPALLFLTSPFFESLFPCQSMGILLAFFQKTSARKSLSRLTQREPKEEEQADIWVNSSLLQGVRGGEATLGMQAQRGVGE